MRLIALQMANLVNRGKRFKNADDADEMRSVLEKHARTKTDGDCHLWTLPKVCGLETVRSGGRASYWSISFVERSL